MTRTTLDKAVRLVCAGAVSRLPGLGGGATFWAVESSDTYTVATRGDRARCSCPAGRRDVPCSHALAALHTAKTYR